MAWEMYSPPNDKPSNDEDNWYTGLNNRGDNKNNQIVILEYELQFDLGYLFSTTALQFHLFQYIHQAKSFLRGNTFSQLELVLIRSAEAVRDQSTADERQKFARGVGSMEVRYKPEILCQPRARLNVKVSAIPIREAVEKTTLATVELLKPGITIVQDDSNNMSQVDNPGAMEKEAWVKKWVPT
jgi:hypothetical protein